MSGFTVRKPTPEEIHDVSQAKVTHVHMTSDAVWEPTTKTDAHLEGTLRDSITRGTDLYHQEPRDLSQLQVRGQIEGTLGNEDDCLFQEATDDFDEGIHSYQDLVSLKSIQTERAHTGALDVDRYAEVLMAELGVTELGMDDLGAHLAAIHTTKKRPGFVDAQQLSKNWGIGLEAAKRTVEATTQLAVRDFSHTTGGRRLKPSHWVLNQKRLDCEVYTDTMFGKCKSLRGNTCAQIFATAFHFVRCFAMESKKDAYLTLDDFFRQVGIPQVLVPDNAKELTLGEFRKRSRRAQCPIHPIEAYTPNKNLAEAVIRELKRHYRRVMIETGAPEVLWDYCLEWCALVRSHTALNIHALDGKTPATKMTGDTSDISFLAEFGWYDWVWYMTPQGSPGQEATEEPTLGTKQLGRYLGPAINVGDAMCGTVLTERGQRLDRTSIIPLSDEDKNSEGVKMRKQIFEKVLATKLKDIIKAMRDGEDPAKLDDMEEKAWRLEHEATPIHQPYGQWDPAELGFDIQDDDGKEPLPELADADDFDLNRYLSAKVKLPRDGHTFATGRVIRRARDSEGQLIGKESHNPLLDSSLYEVEFEDGSIERYHANIIAEHIYSQIDEDGYGRTLLDEIIEH